MTDEDIDYSDIPELGDEFLTKATVPFPTSYTNRPISENPDYSPLNTNKSLHQAKWKQPSKLRTIWIFS